VNEYRRAREAAHEEEAATLARAAEDPSD